MLELTLPPNFSPSIQPYARANAQAVGSPIEGEAVSGRPTLYEFDVSGLADGDYVVDITDPYGRFVLRKSNTTYLMADEWWQLDYLTNPADDPSKILVNQDYGGPGALTYSLNGIPVDDATIELFLYSDYIAGNVNGNYRINNSRQQVDGTWAVPFYLDPQDYVIRYYRNGVAGPDSWKVVVSFDPSEIEITPLDVIGGGAALGASPQPLRMPEVPAQLHNNVMVDHNYGGPNVLVYRLNGEPVAGATIQMFKADDYNSGHRLPVNIVAQTEQNADGSWAASLPLPPGRYIMNCFKKNVAGPNAFSLVVE